MTETEVERLVVRMLGDNAQLRQSIQQGIKDFEAFGRKAEQEVGPNGTAGRAMRGFGVNARGMMMLSRGALHLVNAKNAQQQLQGLNQVVMAVGRQFGVMGMLGASAFSMVMSKSDDAQKAANKAFSSMVDGAKSFNTVLAEADFATFKKGMDEAVEALNPTTVFGDIKKFALEMEGAKIGFRPEDLKRLILNKIVVDQKRMHDLLENLNKDPAMKEVIRMGQASKAGADLAKERDSLALKRETVGLQGEAVKLYRIEKQLRESMADPSKFAELDKARNDAANLTLELLADQMLKKQDMVGVEKADVEWVKKRQEIERIGAADWRDQVIRLQRLQKHYTGDQTEYMNKTKRGMETAGLTPGQLKAFELMHQEFPPPKNVIDAAAALADMAAAYDKMAKSALSMEQKNLGFGLTGPEAERQAFKTAGGNETDAAYQRSLAAEQKGQLNELSKATDAYAQSMEGLTAAQKAAANAAKGGWSKELAYQTEVLKEAAQVTEQYMLPVDKYLKEQRKLDELLKLGTITQETYNRALGAAQKQLNAVVNAEAQSAYGSAAASRELYKFVQANRPVTNQSLALGGSEAGANAALGGKVDKTNTTLELIRKLLAKEEDKPKVDLKLGTGGQLL